MKSALSHMNNFQKNTLGVFLLLAIVLGFFVYNKAHPGALFKSNTYIQTTNSPSSVSDESKLLNVPAPGASQAEIDQHSQLAAKLAVIGNEIEIGDCKAKPLVLQLKQDTTFNLKNNGSLNLSITFDNNHVYYVNAGKSVAVKASFDHGPGLYGYRCITDATNTISGFVLLTP